MCMSMKVTAKGLQNRNSYCRSYIPVVYVLNFFVFMHTNMLIIG